MNKKQIEYNKKYRKNKGPLYIWINRNDLREFKMICKYRGFKMNFILSKMIVDFNKKYEVKVLE